MDPSWGSVNVINELVCQKEMQEVSHKGLSVVQVANKNILRKDLKIHHLLSLRLDLGEQ